MNQGLHLLFLRQGKASLEDFFFFSFFYHNNIKLQVRTNHKLYEMQKAKHDETGHKIY